MSILVTGGAGYVGGVVVDDLVEAGEDVVIIDNLSRSSASEVHDNSSFYKSDIGDREQLAAVLARHDIDVVLHFAGLIAVGESVEYPARFFDSNVAQSIVMLEVLDAAGVELVVFSSSAAVYGEPEVVPIPEDHPHRPESPYGWTKSAVERMLADMGAAGSMRSTSLRYFNAAGATPHRIERHDPETHLIPMALGAVTGEYDKLVIFGDDYPTPDGTAVRDYVHVSDLSAAHLAAVEHLRAGGAGGAFNLGGGEGSSVLDLVDTIERVTGSPVPREMGPRRAGDPAVLVASSERAERVLGWERTRSDLETIIASVWAHFTA